jgi:hypothetical protein
MTRGQTNGFEVGVVGEAGGFGGREEDQLLQRRHGVVL